MLRHAARRTAVVQLHHSPAPFGMSGLTTAATGSDQQAAPSVLQNKMPNGCLVVTLNRPQALNALNHEMIQSLTRILKEGESDPSVRAFVVKGAGEKAFCAGGDIRALAQSASSGDLTYAHQFFAEEYQLDNLIHNLKKPYIAVMDGITMGGGVGISIGARYRVASEKVLFAMPETGIGFFPDVGGTYFLPRLQGGIGMYLALTGERLRAPDVAYSGISTHYVSRSSLKRMEESLCQKQFTDVETVLNEFASTPQGESTLAQNKADIDACFEDANNVEQVLERLQQRKTEWANNTLNTLRAKSPASLKITFEGLKRGKNLTLEKALQQELRMALRFMQSHDFVEGVRAVLVDKDNKPQWKPTELDQVDGKFVSAYFDPLADAKQELQW